MFRDTIKILKQHIEENEKKIERLPPHPFHDLPHRGRADLEILNAEMEVAVLVLKESMAKEKWAIKKYNKGRGL